MQESKKEFLGVHVAKCCEELVKEAKELDTEVFVEFNDIKIIANKNSDPIKLLENYRKESNERSANYQSSDEYIFNQSSNQKEINKCQVQLNQQIEKLNSLDFSDIQQVLQWTCDTQEYTDRVGVRVPVETIISTFERNNYFVGVNTGDNLKEDDEDNVARYIIGQALSCLQQVGAIHSIIHKFTQQWNQKFR